jgi:hypothetical protein
MKELRWLATAFLRRSCFGASKLALVKAAASRRTPRAESGR